MTQPIPWDPPEHRPRHQLTPYPGLDLESALLRNLRTYLETFVPGEYDLLCHSQSPVHVLISWTGGIPIRDLAVPLAPDTDPATPVRSVHRSVFSTPVELRFSRVLPPALRFAGVDHLVETRALSVPQAIERANWSIDPTQIPTDLLTAWSSLLDTVDEAWDPHNTKVMFTQLQPRARALQTALT